MNFLIAQLARRHQRVEEALRSEMRKAWPDFARIARLKKIKLAIKDRLCTLKSQPGAA